MTGSVNQTTPWYKSWWLLLSLVVISIIIGSSGLAFSLQKTTHTQSLYTTNLNKATFIGGQTEMKLLYSFPTESGSNTPSGFFTVVVDPGGGNPVPNITYEVRDQTDRNITSGNTIVGKTTVVNFEGTSNTRNVDLYIKPVGTNISLQNLTVTLNNTSLYTK